MIIEPGSVTTYGELRERVTAQVESGELRPGDRLPTVRALAAELGLAVNTVARAYRELEQDGLVVGRGRAGTFVADADDARAAKAAARDFVARARALDVDVDAAVALVREAFR